MLKDCADWPIAKSDPTVEWIQGEFVAFCNLGGRAPMYPTNHYEVWLKAQPFCSEAPAGDPMGELDRIGTIAWVPDKGYTFFSGFMVTLGVEISPEAMEEIKEYIAAEKVKAPAGPSMEDVKAGRGGPGFIMVSLPARRIQ